MTKTPNPAFHKVDAHNIESLRIYWLRWLNYKFRTWHENEYDEWMDLHDTLFKEWARRVIGRPHAFMESLLPYFTQAFNTASLAQLQEFIALRYEKAHPVPDGWTLDFRAGLCKPSPALAFVLLRR